MLSKKSTSSSESDFPQSAIVVQVEEVAALTSFKYIQESKSKKLLERCRSNPERSWKSKGERIPMLEIHKPENTLEQQPTTTQPQLSYFAYLGNSAARMGRYRSLSTDADVIINMGYGIFAVNEPEADTSSRTTEEQGSDDAVYNQSIKAQQHLDCFTCKCCVKALFYHGTKDYQFERDWADEPCACVAPGLECAARWGMLGILSTFMPCLLFYPICKRCCR